MPLVSVSLSSVRLTCLHYTASLRTSSDASKAKVLRGSLISFCLLCKV